MQKDINMKLHCLSFLEKQKTMQTIFHNRVSVSGFEKREKSNPLNTVKPVTATTSDKRPPLIICITACCWSQLLK